MNEVIALLLAVIVGLLAKFLHSYSSKKGENRAIKEDIEELTRKVEEVRLDFALQVEQHSQNRVSSFTAKTGVRLPLGIP